MRTDDFEDVQPQDTDEPRPDKQPIDVDGGHEEFNEFDQPTTTGGSSLGDVWRNNPLIKIAVITICVITLVAGYLVFGGKGGDAPKSSVGQALQESEAPGGPASEAYTQAVNDVNQQRLEAAMQTGTSSIPIPTAGTDVPVAKPVAEEPPVSISDPLADWRASVQQPSNQSGGSAQQLNQPTLQQTPGQGYNNQSAYPQQQQALGPDPQAVDALAQAMGQQMSAILDKHKITGPQVMTVTDADYLDKKNAADAAKNQAQTTTTNTTDQVEEILIPAGTIVYAQTMTEANSDVPGPVLARISSGPLTGSRVLGTFSSTSEKLVLTFNKVVINGIAYPISGIALDPKTTLPAVATDVDHRYFQRFILPAAASFIEGMGDAISNREQTNVSVNGSTVTSSKPDLNTTEELAAGLAEGTSNIADDLDEQGDSVKVLVKVHAGTPVGILFLEPVIKQE